MSDQRKIIRQAAKDAVDGQTDAAGRVFRSRSSAFWRQELPAIAIYCGREVITIEQEAPRKYRRELELRFEVGAEATGAEPEQDVDDQLDDIGHQIEQCVGRSNRLTFAKEPSVAEIQLVSDTIEISKDGARVVGALVKTYSAIYYTLEPDELDPEPLDDLKKVHTEYNLSGAQAPADRASDDIEYPT